MRNAQQLHYQNYTKFWTSKYFIFIAMKTVRKFPNQISNLSICAGEMWNLIYFYNENENNNKKQQNKLRTATTLPNQSIFGELI